MPKAPACKRTDGVMGCRGICPSYRAYRSEGPSRYACGQKRCQICDLFLKCDGNLCPCCGYRLRTKPRGTKYKEKMRAMKVAPSVR
ncbi:MAG: hypothetical protein QXJ74_02925 [Nitrososphaera sp.]